MRTGRWLLERRVLISPIAIAGVANVRELDPPGARYLAPNRLTTVMVGDEPFMGSWKTRER